MNSLPRRFNMSSSDASEPVGATHVSVVRYAPDPAVSRFTVRAFASGLLSVFGHDPTIAIRDFAGEIQFVPDSLDDASLHLRIRADSLGVQDQISEKDRREMESLMRGEVLETSNFPEIVYDCSEVSANAVEEGQYSVVLNGYLTLHGVTRREPVTARVVINAGLLRTFGDFSIRQTDYNIKLVNAIGGTLKVKNELKFAFDIVARKQDE